jgi:hypothetical protein
LGNQAGKNAFNPLFHLPQMFDLLAILKISEKMKYLTTLFLASVLAFGCSEISENSLKSALVGQSYYLRTSPEQSFQVEFFEKCAKHYNWEAFIVDEWELREGGNGGLLLHFDTHDFVPKQLEDGTFEFFCEKTGQQLVKAQPLEFNAAVLNGTWEDAHYAGATPGMPLPTCPEKSAMVPAFVFNAGSVTVRDFCTSSEQPFFVNPTFKIINIGEPCSSQEQLKIKELSPTKMVVDRQFEKDGKMNIEYNKWYVKMGG